MQIDFTNLKPDATKHDIIKTYVTAVSNNYYSICVNPDHVSFVKELVEENKSNLKICSVIGYPLGANKSYIKLLEAENAIVDGADELDIVMAIGAFKEKDYNKVLSELETFVNLCRVNNVVSKVIIETGLLNEFELIQATRLVKNSGADFIKSCTSSLYGAVNTDSLRTIRNIEPSLKIKASGGIRTAEQLEILKEIGVERIGTSTIF